MSQLWVLISYLDELHFLQTANIVFFQEGVCVSFDFNKLFA